MSRQSKSKNLGTTSDLQKLTTEFFNGLIVEEIFLLFLSFFIFTRHPRTQKFTSYFREHEKGKSCDDNLEDENVREDFDDNAGNHDGGNFGANDGWDVVDHDNAW